MKKFIIILILGLVVRFAFGQDPHFSQFYATPLYLAPSFAGSSENTRLMTNYRDQWPKMPGTFVTYSFAADHYIDEYNSGLGLFVMKDQAGSGKIDITSISANYAYRVKLNNKWFFRPGLKVFYYQNFINYNKIIFNDQLDFEQNNPTSVEIPEDNRTNYIDFGTSFLFHNDQFWVGGAADHLIKASPSFRDNLNYAPMKYSIFGGANIPIEKLRFQRKIHKMIATFQLKRQGQTQQLDLGAYYQKNSIMVGLWYRGIPLVTPTPTTDALILLLGYTNSNMTIGYSYDLTISRLITYTGGAHELSFIYRFNSENLFGRERHSAIPCPAL
jgi:type IX secretion system PorP/SprF family membrane protein